MFITITNMLNESHWYAAKTKHQTEKKIKSRLAEMDIECFVPFHTLVVERNGKKIKQEKPLVPNLVFIYTDRQTALSLPNDTGIDIIYMRDLTTRQLLIIPDKQMEDFMFLHNFSPNAIRVMNTNLKKGDRVKVIKGEFSGIEGELIRIQGHKRVVIRLEGLFSLATTYIPKEFLELIDISNQDYITHC